MSKLTATSEQIFQHHRGPILADASFRPSAIVASGRTARALEPLLSPQFIFGIAGTKMFRSMPEALGRLKRVLEQEGG